MNEVLRAPARGVATGGKEEVGEWSELDEKEREREREREKV